jgi:predicted nucleic acid-binding protein
MMFLLDTNVLSAMMQLGRVPEVAAWMSQQDEDLLFTSAISHAKIFSGLVVLPDGRRRRRELEITAREMFGEFEERVLSFDIDAAAAYPELFAIRRQAGRPIAVPDLMIAAIARANGGSVVTRDTGGFEGCGLTLINPWEAS